jgi:iron complex transport system ATP-binding protein
MLELQSINVSYGQRMILHDVSLRVSAGQVLALIGPNGAGKSTIIRSISGVLPINSGKIILDGKEITRLTAERRARLMAVVPQARQLPGEFAVYDTVLLGRTPYLNWLGSTGSSDHTLVRNALELAQLSNQADKLVGELSGGEQQRVLLARAIAQNAPLLLLDEPTTHLDLEHQSTLLNLFSMLAREKGLAVLMVLHDLNSASLYADQVALLVSGKIQALGTPEEVITAENLARVYRVPVNVIQHPQYGTPLVLPDGRNGVN